jgi:hypothetical protein
MRRKGWQLSLTANGICLPRLTRATGPAEAMRSMVNVVMFHWLASAGCFETLRVPEPEAANCRLRTMYTYKPINA